MREVEGFGWPMHELEERWRIDCGIRMDPEEDAAGGGVKGQTS